VVAACSFDAKFMILLRVSFPAKCPFTTLFILVAATLSSFLFCRSVLNMGCSDVAFSYLSRILPLCVFTFHKYNVLGTLCMSLDG
jgi:hypothetical protein